MSNLFNTFETDPKKEAEGVDVEYGTNDDGTIPTFRVARISRSNPKYAKAVERKTRPYRRQIDLDTIDRAVADELTMKIFIESILLGWQNVQDKSGALIPYNVSNALGLFKALPDLFFDLQDQASKASLFRMEQVEAEAKN